MTSTLTPPTVASQPATPFDESSPTPASGPLAGTPGLVGLPVVVTGGTGLVLTDLGFFSDGAAPATLTLLLGCTVVGLTIATIWAAALGDSISASFYAIFGGFYASYIALSAAGTHAWFGPVGDQASHAWLVCWLVTIGLLIPITLRLAAITTIMLVLVEIALALLLASGVADSTALLRAAAVAIAGFVGTVAWQYADLMLIATGGRGLPLGRPLLSE